MGVTTFTFSLSFSAGTSGFIGTLNTNMALSGTIGTVYNFNATLRFSVN